MYLNGSLHSLNSSLNNPNNLIELDGNDNLALSTTTSIQQTNIISSNTVQSAGGSNSNLSKLNLIQNTSSIQLPPCKLCGTQISSMKCNECLGMNFCYSCDNSFHQHPKRRSHKRKSINSLNTTTNYFTNDDTNILRHPSSSSINNLPNQQQLMIQSKNVPFKQIRGLEHSTSMSAFSNNNHTIYSNNFDPISSASIVTSSSSSSKFNLPIPPPRRKKSRNNPNEPIILNNTRRLPGMEQNTFNNPLSSSCGNLAQLNRQSPMHFNFNQLNNNAFINQNNNNLPINRRQSVENWQHSKIPQQQTSYVSPHQFNNLQNIRNIQQLQNIQNLQNGYIKSQQRHPLINPYLQKRNLSLTDINSKNVQLLAANGLNLNILPYSFDMNSVSQSMDDIIGDESFSDDDNYSSNSSRKHRHFNRKNRNVKRSSSRGSSLNENQNLLNQKLIRRSQSSAQLINPPLNPYDFDYLQQNQLLANLYYAQPLLNTGISPASSIRSLEPVKRKSSVNSIISNRTLVNNELYKELDRNKKYRRLNEKEKTRSKSLSRSKSQTSNKSGKSFKSSINKKYENKCMSSDTDDLNNESDDCSVDSTSNCSNFDESTQSEFDDKRKKQWKCKFCTFVNRLQMNICEMCSKSNPQALKHESNRNSRIDNKQINRSNSRSRSKTRSEQLNNKINLNKDDNQKRSSYIEFTDELIKQQEEVEKELLRRIANEKQIQEENLRIEKKELNVKSRAVLNSNIKESENILQTTNLKENNETNDLIKASPPVSSSLTSSSHKNSTNISNKNIVSKIKPPSITLKQQNNAAPINKQANKLIKNHSLDSNIITGGRQREESKFSTAKQSGDGKDSNVQQSTYFKSIKLHEEQKNTNSNLINQPEKGTEQLNYDKKILEGMTMFKLLKEAEKKDYLAEELEIALSFNINNPIEWLDDNWPSMRETVLTLANNQLLTFCQQLNSNLISTVNDEEARNALRFAKGNVWTAVDRCVNLKKEEIKESQTKKSTGIDKHDIKSFTFNLKSPGQGLPNRDSNVIRSSNIPTILINQEPKLSISQLSKMESLLNDWYQNNLKKSNQSDSDGSNRSKTPKTSEKVKNLITFLKQNGFFDTNKQNQDEIDEQMKILMNLLEKKLKEAQEINQSNSLNNSSNSSRSTTSFKSNTSLNSSNLSKSNNSNLIDLSSSNNQEEELPKNIDKEFEEIDEKMKQSLNFLDEIEQKAKEKIINDKKPKEEFEIKRTNFKNLKITSKVSIDDDKDQSIEYQDATDKLSVVEPVHNVNIKLESPVDVTANYNLKKEKGKIKIIKRKIYRNSSSDQKKIEEKIAYVNNIEEADLINLDDEINLSISYDNEKSKTDDEIKDKIDKEEIKLEKQEETENNNQLLIDDDKERQLNQLNPNFQFARTYYECELCASKHHINELISMLFCTHRACKSCLIKYFTIQIREKQRVIIKCPFCDQPDIQSDDENAVHEYLTLLQELIKNIVTKDLYELFQRKVRDRALQKDETFKWCKKCCSGFLAANIEGPILRCPDCLSLSCSKCGEMWKEEHRVLTCEQFKEWLIGGNEWMAEHQVTIHLNEFGIVCPKCRYKYELSKGGCLHFKCVQCEYEFCYGCDSEFRQKCKKSCEKLGFHAHHPRNCLFYLRDKKAEDLEKLLKLNNIEYEIKDYDKSKTECDIMEQKETEDGNMKDEKCGRKVEKNTNGICNLHYIEHLARLIKINHIDPIIIFDENELANVLKREYIDVPRKFNYTIKTYKTKLIELIEKHLPL